MSYFEKNMSALKKRQKDIYEALLTYEAEEEILVGDALNGEHFFARLEGNQMNVIGSTYHPSHEAERYVEQFKDHTVDTRLFLFGFGTGLAVRRILSAECPVCFCIVYEPSLSLFQKVMAEYDLQDILLSEDFVLMIRGLHDEYLERFLYDLMNYESWRSVEFHSLYGYEKMYREVYKDVLQTFIRVRNQKISDMNTLVHFAESGMVNEIKALKWMIDCKALPALLEAFPKDVPCIIVAAGPSLEKNVEVLHQAKGKAVIMCVDTALHYLLDRGIMPDITCTIDPNKGASYFSNPKVREIPILTVLQSDYRSLEEIHDVKAIYLNAENTFYNRLFGERGYMMNWREGGGSVATVCFSVALLMGFETIVVIGQDLAFSDDKSHAGQKLKQSDYVYQMSDVDGYYGGKVRTRRDFRQYIEWYNLTISENKDRRIINATEGGAKLEGALQLPLQEVVDQYCTKDIDVGAIMDTIPEVWPEREDKYQFYQEIKQKYKDFQYDIVLLKRGLTYVDRILVLLTRTHIDYRELEQLEKKIEKITEHMDHAEELVILIRRIIELDIDVSGDLYKKEEDMEQESSRLYEKLKRYYQGLVDAIEELLPIWEKTMKDINEKYEFE